MIWRDGRIKFNFMIFTLHTFLCALFLPFFPLTIYTHKISEKAFVACVQLLAIWVHCDHVFHTFIVDLVRGVNLFRG